MILLIDNYDSFSYNLYQLVGEIDPAVRVVRNDAMTVAEVRQGGFSHIILSPGPGRPENAGICVELVRALGGTVPILGVCLGHQAICAAFGARITYAGKLMHGKASEVRFDLACPLFAGCPEVSPAARYHSLVADPATIRPPLLVTARTADNVVMAVRHEKYPVYGLQFHPESILTPIGKTIIKNFLEEEAQ